MSSASPQTATSAPPSTTKRAGGAAVVAVTAADRARAARIVAGMSLADRAASVLMVTGREAVGTGLLARQHVGGVILFAPGGIVDGTSKGTPAQVAAVTAALRADAATDPAGVPPLIATDQEYGLVQRLKHGFTTFPRAVQLGAIGDIDRASTITRQAATAAAQEMRAVGVTVNFAPVFGVLPAGGGPSAIGQYGRSYGSDPQRVARLVAAAVTGYQDGGVVASMKHFPGLARIAADSHVTLPTLRVSCADWNAHEAIPARAGIDAGALMVMTGHMLLPASGDTKLPASLSPVIVQKLLKGNGAAGCDGMGFDGVTVTDSMEMAPITDTYGSGAAAVQALAAGEDLILMSANPTKAAAGIVAAVNDGTLPAARLDDAATSVLALRIASARVPTPPLDVVNSAAHRELAAQAFAAAK
jgi:beta-N-acetylhexosaminidase